MWINSCQKYAFSNSAWNGWTSTALPWLRRKPLGWFIQPLTEMTINEPVKPARTIGIPVAKCSRGDRRAHQIRPGTCERPVERIAAAKIPPLHEQEQCRKSDPETDERDVHRERQRLHLSGLQQGVLLRRHRRCRIALTSIVRRNVCSPRRRRGKLSGALAAAPTKCTKSFPHSGGDRGHRQGMSSNAISLTPSLAGLHELGQ